MNIKRSVFSLAAWCCLIVLPGVGRSANSLPDSLPLPTTQRLDRRRHAGYDGWERLTPTHVKLQFAGGIGIVSAGFGWDYGRKCRWETDVLLGYVPKFDSRSGHATFTVKQNYIPWSIACTPRFAIEPFTCSVYVSVITGQEFWTRIPERYPTRSYYSMPTKLRAYLSLGQRFTWYFREKRKMRCLTAYYELGTCDYYIVTKLSNKYIGLTDIFSLSLGLKLQLF